VIEKFIEQPIAGVAILLMLFGAFFAGFYKRTRPISEPLIWAALCTLLAVISFYFGLGGSRYIDFYDFD
jgi:O-antigen ligase